MSVKEINSDDRFREIVDETLGKMDFSNGSPTSPDDVSMNYQWELGLVVHGPSSFTLKDKVRGKDYRVDFNDNGDLVNTKVSDAVVENSPTLTFIEHDSVDFVNYLSRFTSVIHDKPISEPGSIEVCPFLTSWEE